jgi:chromatin segregation and condensation protein Rec8/ScpA/Scc1 (kleisin family)
MSSMTESAAVDPAEARKRRKEIMQSLRADGEETNGKAAEQTATADDALPPKKRKVARKESAKETEEQSKKTQVRYDPEIPMEKDQLAAWRKEARRVRNRESAAASRQRIRDRIAELEGEIGQWKQKYAMAMERLERLERVAAETNAEVGL